MSISLLFGRKSPPSIGEIELDLSLSESHVFTSDVTEFPVEDGSDITDHIVNKPDKITINGFVTNAPIRLLTTAAVGLARPGGNLNRTELVFDALERLHRTREPIEIVTSLKVYESMAMQELTVPKNAQVGDSLEFSASFSQIRKVTSETVLTEDLAQDTTGTKAGTSDQASDTRDAGNQPTSAADDSKKNGASAGYRLFFRS